MTGALFVITLQELFRTSLKFREEQVRLLCGVVFEPDEYDSEPYQFTDLEARMFLVAQFGMFYKN